MSDHFRKDRLAGRSIVGIFVVLLLFAVLASSCTNQYTNKPTVFAPKVGVCTSTKNAEIVKTANVDYIEAGVQRFLIPFESDEKFAEKLSALRQSGMTVRACNSFIPGSIKSVGPKADHDKLLKYVETAFQRAQRAGIKFIVFGSSGSRSIPKGFDRDQAKSQFVSLLKRMGPIAAKYDVTVAIEPLNRKETNFIISVTEGHEIVKLVDHKNIRLLADFYHMLRENEGPESIVEAGKYLVHAHVAENQGRCYPGKNGEDFTPYLAALKQIGYTGSISIECRWGNFSEELAPAAAYLRKQIMDMNADDQI